MAFSIDNTYFTNYSTDASDVSSARLTDSLQSASTDEETLEACKQFEVYMIEQMYKNMEESAKLFSDEEDDSSNDYVDMFSDNYYQDIADKMVNSGQGLGIAEQLYDSIMKQKGTAVTE